MIVLKSRVGSDPGQTPVRPRTVVGISTEGMVVAAGQGTRLKLLELRPEGRRSMTVRDFLAGHPTPVGTRLGFDRGQTPGQTQ